MVILRSQNKITDFFMLLAWASPFKFCIYRPLGLISDNGNMFHLKEHKDPAQCWLILFEVGPKPNSVPLLAQLLLLADRLNVLN